MKLASDSQNQLQSSFSQAAFPRVEESKKTTSSYPTPQSHRLPPGSSTGTALRIQHPGPRYVVPTIGDLRSGRSGAGSLDAGGLGERNEPAIRTVSGSTATSRDGSTEATCGRHTSSSIGAWEWKNQDRSTVDLRERRIGQQETRLLQRCGSPTRRIARANIRKHT
jgi:hypothetical protein